MLQPNKIIFIISTVVLLIVILVFLIVRLGRSKHGGNSGSGGGNSGSGVNVGTSGGSRNVRSGNATPQGGNVSPGCYGDGKDENAAKATKNSKVIRAGIANATCPTLKEANNLEDKCWAPNFPTGGDTDMKNMVKQQNFYRNRANGAAPLIWDRDLADKSKSWTDYLSKNEKGAMRHPGSKGEIDKYLMLKNERLGANIAQYTGRGQTPYEHTCFGWGPHEQEGYKIGCQNNDRTGQRCMTNQTGADERESGGEVGHFTQMVWKDSKKVGCSKSDYTPSDITLINCNYYPAGNVIGGNESFIQNVDDGLKGSSRTVMREQKSGSSDITNFNFNKGKPLRKSL
jgi:hypothetical protein